jgi:tetratricopeptide (TPR) repeat protein
MAIAWQLEGPEVVEEVEALSLLIRETDSSRLAFALYRTVGDREAAVRALKERVSLPVVEFTLSSAQKNPLVLLRKLPTGKRACVFFYDVEEALPQVTGYLNLQREAFAEVPHATIFWVREHGLREIATHAPDFWAWRSGVFDFRSEQVRLPVPVMQRALAEPLIFRDRGDLDRRISLYQGLIREYSSQAEPDERFLTRLQLKLSEGFYLLARFNEAEGCVRDALERSRRAGDSQGEAAAMHALGVLAWERSRFEEAEQWHRKALEIYERLGLEAGAAASYHQLGMISQERQRFDEAEQWYRKALEIFERLGLERNAADEYHQLGMIAQERQRFDEAEQWYRKALEICERLGLERDAASDYHQLGMIAQERQRFDEAEQWYRKALEIKERLGLERDAADEYHHLGTIAQQRQRFDEAEQWYRKALEISERLGLERDAADEYHHLGTIAQQRQRFDEAEQWYRKALEIKERLGHPPLLVNTLAQFGLLRREQQRHTESVQWLAKALAIAAEYKMRVGGKILRDLARLFKAMGEQEFVAAWREAFQGEAPPLEALRRIMESSETPKG